MKCVQWCLEAPIEHTKAFFDQMFYYFFNKGGVKKKQVFLSTFCGYGGGGVLHCTALHCTNLGCTALHWTAYVVMIKKLEWSKFSKTKRFHTEGASTLFF